MDDKERENRLAMHRQFEAALVAGDPRAIVSAEWNKAREALGLPPLGIPNGTSTAIGPPGRSPVSAQSFLNLWRVFCFQREAMLFADWSKASTFTSHVFHESDSLITEIANHLELSCYCNYYSLDAILFEEQDRVPACPPGQTWVRRIRIAFEHENFFESGLFQEVSHLLITDCDLRVVVSYPGNPGELATELQYLHGIIAGSDRSDHISRAQSFLFIAGWRNPIAASLSWDGYIYGSEGWQKIAAWME